MEASSKDYFLMNKATNETKHPHNDRIICANSSVCEMCLIKSDILRQIARSSPSVVLIVESASLGKQTIIQSN